MVAVVVAAVVVVAVVVMVVVVLGALWECLRFRWGVR